MGSSLKQKKSFKNIRDVSAPRSSDNNLRGKIKQAKRNIREALPMKRERDIQATIQKNRIEDLDFLGHTTSNKSSTSLIHHHMRLRNDRHDLSRRVDTCQV